jgi:predicted TPR repeat methyltransferase
MTAQDFQYLKDTEEKALKVIASCTTKQQARNAKRYVKLLQNRYGDRFNLGELFKLDYETYNLCNDVTWKLDNKVRIKLASLKNS